MNLLRKYKLNKYLHIPLTSDEQKIFDFIDSWLIRLTPFKSYYSTATFYMKEDSKWVLEEEFDNWLRIRDKGFCDVITNHCKISDKELEKFFKIYLRDFLNREVRGVTIYKGINPIIVEQEFRKKQK